jgi:hypothetical protein
MDKKVKLIAKQIPVAEVKAREAELRELYYRIRLMVGDDDGAARRNAEELLRRSLSTGVIVELP